MQLFGYSRAVIYDRRAFIRLANGVRKWKCDYKRLRRRTFAGVNPLQMFF